jgi:hypothetical protein
MYVCLLEQEVSPSLIRHTHHIIIIIIIIIMYTTNPPPRNTSRRGWREKRRAGDDDDNVSKHLTSPPSNKTLSQILEFEVSPNLSR